MTLRERLASTPCPVHGRTCSVVGVRANRRLTFNCGRDYHLDDPTLRLQALAVAHDEE